MIHQTAIALVAGTDYNRVEIGRAAAIVERTGCSPQSALATSRQQLRSEVAFDQPVSVRERDQALAYMRQHATEDFDAAVQAVRRLN